MSIKINKIESIVKEPVEIMSEKYGKIKIVNDFNKEGLKYNDYTYFDETDGYDLYISTDAENIIGIKHESMQLDVKNNEYEDVISNIKNKYNISDVYFDKAESAIIIKSKDKEVLDKIKDEYFNKFIIDDTIENILFLENPDSEIQLEDYSPLDKLSDQDMKTVINKAGIKLNGNENKDQLKGIMQGMATQTK